MKQHHQATRQRTVTLVTDAVDHLRQEGQTVTLEAICARTRSLDERGKGVTKAGVLGNPEAHAYYRRYSSTYQRGLGRQRSVSGKPRVSTSALRVASNRDLERVRQRYLKQSKADLVERLLTVEQVLASRQQQLAQLQFELLTLQEQLEELEQPKQRKRPKQE